MKLEMQNETKCEVQTKELLRALRELGEAIEDLGCNPNYGGCCIIAAIVCGELERLGIQCEVATADPEYAAYGNTAKYARDNGIPVNKWSDEVCRHHLVVRFKAGGFYYTWDTEGLRRDRVMPAFNSLITHPFGEGMSAEEAEELYENSTWNWDFDTDCIPEIRELARQYLRP